LGVFGLRKATVKRKTNETSIVLELNVDGSDERSIDCGIGFLNHMLDLFAKHGSFDLSIRAKGDLEIDEHHTVEDIGIVLGQAFKKALGEKKGIKRYGFFSLPMDEALANVTVDLSGRSWLVFNAEFEREKVGDLSTELIEDFFQAFAMNAGANIHINLLYGRNAHHKIEAIFKCFAKALKMACEKDKVAKGTIPSTKGIL